MHPTRTILAASLCTLTFVVGDRGRLRGGIALAVAEHDAGWTAYREGRLDEAAARLKAAVKEAKALGAAHPAMATTLDHLAWVDMARGKPADAEPLARWSVAWREKAAGADRDELAQALNTLACLCDAQGKYAEAEATYARCLALEEKARGAEPSRPSPRCWITSAPSGTPRASTPRPRPPTAAPWPSARRRPEAARPAQAPTLHNLATLYLDTDRPALAEPLHRRALALREAALGPDDPDVLASLDGLARACLAQGRYAESDRLEARAAALRTKLARADAGR